MPKLPVDLNRKQRWLLIAVLLLTGFQLIEQLLSGSGTYSVFRYQRELILDGEYYRLLTAHLVHLSWTHFALNVSGLGICILLLDGSSRGLTHSLVLGVLAISIGLLQLYPEVEWYAGYSGVLYGQVLYALLSGVSEELQRARLGAAVSWLRLGLLLLGALYLVYRVLAGLWTSTGTAAVNEVSDTLIDAPILHEAHLLGAVGGLLAFVLLCLRKSPQT